MKRLIIATLIVILVLLVANTGYSFEGTGKFDTFEKAVWPKTTATTLTDDGTFTQSDIGETGYRIFLVDPGGTNRNYNPSGSFVVGTTIKIENTADAAETITFDSAGIAASIIQDNSSTFIYNGSAWENISDGGGSANVEDAEYTSGWNGDTSNAPSQNAVYDYLHQIDADDDGSLIDETDFTSSGTGNFVRVNTPTLVTPILGAATATSLTLDASAYPSWVHSDSDGAGGDAADKASARYGASFSTTTEDAEISDFALNSWGGAVAGTEYTNIFWDGSDNHLYMGVLAAYTGANPSVAPLDVANYESLVWDFDYGTDTVGVSSPVNGTTTIDYTTLNLLTTGSLAGRPVITSAGSERVLTAAECSGGIVLVTAAVEVQVPDVCDSATGAMVMIVQADASETIEIAVTDTDDHFFLDGVDLGANQEIDSPGDAIEDNYICLLCREANEWHSFGRSGTWVDGGAAD